MTDITDIREMKARIVVFGVGGAGGNAVNNMIVSGLQGVEFIVANTDAQALAMSTAKRIIQLGTQVTEGLGAGSQPDVGRAAAEETISAIRHHLTGAHMVFVTAGMGGGTGTGAAPIIAKTARDLGILTIGVVTKPFHFEGQRRMRLAEAGIAEMLKVVDTLLIIPNQNLFRVANQKTTFADAFILADQVLFGEIRFGVMGDFEHVAYPWSRFLDGGEERGLVADFQDDVIEPVDLFNDLADVSGFPLDQRGFFQRLCILVAIATDALDVVLVIERAQRPSVVVLPVKETDLDHNAAPGGLGNEVLQTIEIRRVPLIQIELVSGKKVAGLIASRPGEDELCRFHPEGIAGHKFTHGFEQIPGINPRVVKAISLESVEILDVVEFPVDDGSVVLGRGHQDRRLPGL